MRARRSSRSRRGCRGPAKASTTRCSMRVGSVCLVCVLDVEVGGQRRRRACPCMSGPPSVAPTWLPGAVELGAGVSVCRHGARREVGVRCRSSGPSRGSRSCPDFVMTFTKPEEERPNSALAPSATTTTSFTASRLNVNAGRWPPRCSPKNGLLKSAPSTETLFWMPFCPLTVSSSPSGPWTVETPGVSFVKSRKLCPLLGRFSTALWSMRVVPSMRAVSMTGASRGDPDLLLHARELGLEVEGDRLADRQVDALAHEGRETLRGDGHRVGPGRQAQGPEAALLVRRRRLLVVGRGVLERHGRRRGGQRRWGRRRCPR